MPIYWVISLDFPVPAAPCSGLHRAFVTARRIPRHLGLQARCRETCKAHSLHQPPCPANRQAQFSCFGQFWAGAKAQNAQMFPKKSIYVLKFRIVPLTRGTRTISSSNIFARIYKESKLLVVSAE